MLRGGRWGVVDQADVVLQDMQADVNAMLAALASAVQPTIDAMREFTRLAAEAADQLRHQYMPLILELDRIIRRHETLRAQMRRKGKPGWRHWRGHGRG